MKLRYTFLLASLILFTACKKTEVQKCDEPIPDSGLIAASVDFGACVYQNLNSNTYIIQDSIEYSNLQKEIVDNIQEGSICDFPEIDFDKYTILGHYSEGVGCTINFNRSVIADSTALSVKYNISKVECGDCEIIGYSYNFILVEPKVTSDYQISFTTE